MKGFTLFETLISMTIVSVLAVASVYLVFLSLNLRDQSAAAVKNEEIIRNLNRNLRRAVLQAADIGGSSTSLFTTAPNECWSFVYDPVINNLRYGIVSQAGCAPTQSPSETFLSSPTRFAAFTFVIQPLTTGGNQVRVQGVMETTLPFDTLETSFSNTFTNLLDR